MLYLIRHAQSQLNQALLDWAELHPGDMSVHWDVSLTDADLTNLGQSQIEANRPIAQTLPITKVYVSPLRRTLKTCRGLLSGHPYSPIVCVEPLMTEVITDIGDVSLGNGAWRREFAEYDWTAMDMLDSTFWMFDIISSPGMQRLEMMVKAGRPLHASCSSLIAAQSPVPFEPAPYASSRIEAFKTLLLDDLSQGEIVAVVGHSDFFKLFTGSCAEQKQISLKNCEIRPFAIEPDVGSARL